MTIEWTTACPDWESRIRSGETLIPFKHLFQEEAEAGVGVMGKLRVVDVLNSPTIDECCAPWIKDIGSSVFGSYNADTGRREIREFFLLVPKKNTKSTISAAIMLTALIRNWRKSAEFIILAPTLQVANNSFKPARDMVKADDELSALLHIQDNVKTITHRLTGATLKVIAADSNTVGGIKATGVLVDELHLLGNSPNAENMLREATGGLASRPEGFIIYLTTQSDKPPAGIFKQKLEYARGVRDGEIIDKRFLPIIYEFPRDIIEAGEHKDPSNFWMVNPNLGYSVDLEYLTREKQKAEIEGEASMSGFMAKFLNVEVGLALRSNRWAGADYWQQQGKAEVDLGYLLEWSEVICVGIDGGGLDDLLGLSLVGRHKETKKWLSWCMAWANPSVLARRKDIISVLRDFEKDKDVVLAERPGDDVLQVAQIVSQVHDAGLLDKVGVDPVGLGGILDALENEGIPSDMIVAVSQGWRLSGSIKTTERKLAEGTLIHGGRPLMAWCVSNALVEPRGNAVIITKQISGSAKIDPLMALFNAVFLMALNPAATKKKYQMFFV